MKVLVQNISSLRNINLEAMQLTGVIHSICPPVVFHLRQKGSKWLKKKTFRTFQRSGLRLFSTSHCKGLQQLSTQTG